MLDILTFEFLNLFRISDFVLRTCYPRAQNRDWSFRPLINCYPFVIHH